jgi:hypothetical protein
MISDIDPLPGSLGDSAKGGRPDGWIFTAFSPLTSHFDQQDWFIMKTENPVVKLQPS